MMRTLEGSCVVPPANSQGWMMGKTVMIYIYKSSIEILTFLCQLQAKEFGTFMKKVCLERASFPNRNAPNAEAMSSSLLEFALLYEDLASSATKLSAGKILIFKFFPEIKLSFEI